jgi:hypothetical protein
LAGQLLPKIGEGGFEDLFFQIELPLIEVLAEMEMNGVKLDLPLLGRLSREFEGQMKGISERIYELAETNIAAPLLVKLRTELINIERLSNRIAVIKHTSFIPAAYTIAELAAAGVIGILFFVKIDPWYEGLVLFAVLSALLISLILLIKDMDDPFEVGKKSYADVDLSIVFDLEKEWESKAAGKK